MPSFNQVILMGHLSRDPEVRLLANQTPVCNFSLATNHTYKTSGGEKREEVSFFDCTLFGKGGEIVNQYCKKGSALLVTGRLKQENWTDKQTNAKRSKIVVMVEQFKFISNNQNGGNQNQGGQRQQRPSPAQQQEQPDPPFDASGSFDEGEIPF